MRKVFLYFIYVASLFKNLYIQSDEALKNQDMRIKIIQEGNDVIAECPYCNVDSLLWTYKPPNGVASDIVIGKEVIRKKSQSENELWFNISKDDTTCTYILLISSIQMEKAGIYSCWEGLNETKTVIIVINVNNKCSIEPEFSDYKDILLKQNDSVAIKCSFQYSADESCIVTPIWTDLTGYRNLTIPGDDFEVDMDDKHAWIHFKSGVDVTNGTHFNLSFAFNCSYFSNYSQDKNIMLHNQYDFGLVPFTLFLELTKGSSSKFNTLEFSPAVMWSLITAAQVAVVAVSLLLLCLKKYSKLCFTNNRRRTSNTTESEIPMGDRYMGIGEDLRYIDIEELIDGTHETIYENI